MEGTITGIITDQIRFVTLRLSQSQRQIKPIAAALGADGELLSLTLRGFLIYSFCFLFSGFAIFGSSFFAALNNGLISALISFLRTLVLQVAAVLIFPLLLGINGIWVSTVIAEIMAVITTTWFVVKMRKKYGY